MKKPDAWLGIDPGKKDGVACLLTEDKGVYFCRWPSSDILAKVVDQIREWNNDYNIRLAGLEFVRSRPGQNSKSTFSFGRNFGRWEAILTTLGIGFTDPVPQVWQKGAGVKKGDGPNPKIRSAARARQLYPEVDITNNIGNDHYGKSDSLLIAHYIRMNSLGL